MRLTIIALVISLATFIQAEKKQMIETVQKVFKSMVKNENYKNSTTTPAS